MTRPFRTSEDERRYFALRTEFFVRLVQSGVSAQTVHDMMRNFGKMEDMMLFEGVRQGMAVAVLVEANDGVLPLEMHASLYAGGETPLSRIESQLSGESVKYHPYLGVEPLEFGPLTLTEAIEKYGPDLTVDAPRASSKRAAGQIDDPMGVLDAFRNGEDPEAVFAELEKAGADTNQAVLAELAELAQAGLDAASEDDQPLERPDLLDRIREILLKAQPAKNWPELILMVQRELVPPIDAGYLDIMLSSPMGMTVLSQCKLFHLHPGAAVMVGEDGVVVTR